MSQLIPRADSSFLRLRRMLMLTATAGILACQTAPAPAAEVGMAVTALKPKRTCFTDTFQVNGVLVPREEVLVRPEREGQRITQILVEDGEAVGKGQTLARLGAPDIQQGPAQPAAAVVAPAAGIVVVPRSTAVGIMASERGEPLFRIIVRGEMELLADIPGPRVSVLRVSQSAKVDIVGVGELAGRVRVIAPETDYVTQMSQARIFIGSEKRLRSGTFARATIDAGRSCGPAVPMSAVLYGSDGAVVQVVRGDRIETRRVAVGLLSGENAEIREGLSENDLVVAKAGAFLREGDLVRPITVPELPPRR
jgi:multidrug efflux pump subunit AcrA (membrane-fusion protein)